MTHILFSVIAAFFVSRVGFMFLPSLHRLVWFILLSLVSLLFLVILLTGCQAPDISKTPVGSSSQSTKSNAKPQSQPHHLTHNLANIALPQHIRIPANIAPIEPLFADLVEVKKSQRTLSLLHQGQVMRQYPMALGFNPIGHKQKEGDGRTPEGLYKITYKNAQSKFYRSLHISYPNMHDKAIAAAKGVSPGVDIVIHGLPNDDPNARRTQHPNRDWTLGCIAVNNTQIEEIWDLVPSGIPIHILP